MTRERKCNLIGAAIWVAWVLGLAMGELL